MRIRRFLESFQNLHTISTEDLEDYAQELVDEGFKLTIYKKFYSGGKRVEEPIDNKAIPYYEFRFYQIEDKQDENPYRWDGSIYSQSPETLTIFLSLINRLKTLGQVYWAIVGDRFECELWQKEIETETGFDWRAFETKFKDFIQELRERYPPPVQQWDQRSFHMTQGFSTYGSIDYRYSKLPEGFDGSEIRDFLKQYDKWITYDIKLREGKLASIGIKIKMKEK